MKDNDLGDLLNEAVARHGSEKITKVLADLSRSGDETEVLTIIANAGVHEIPQRYLSGEVYEASHGNWDTSTLESLRRELCDHLARLATTLRSTAWKRIYLVPTGHPVLSLQIKAMAYRILRLNTVDLYFKDGEYFEIEIDHQKVGQELQSDFAIELGIGGPIHLTHAALANLFRDFVVSDGLADHSGPSLGR